MVLLLSACAPAISSETSAAVRDTPTPRVVVAVVTDAPTPTVEPTPEIVLTPPYELGAGQHISSSGNYRETETEAAGPMVCRIQRRSPAFYQFVSVYDPRALWSDGETPPYNDEDHLMHPAMLDPFNALVELVADEWNGQTQIMITEAYDSQLNHDIVQQDKDNKYSLHFEGRSIDFIPWPPGEGRLARLCALAHLAGFDWVHNEGDHCHASVRAQSMCELYDFRASP